MSHPKAVIIGAGVAGLAAATRLSIQGFHVTVYEKNSHPGGKLHAFEKEGFHFDAGPSLFTQPANVEELFAVANEPIEQYLQYEKVPVACKYFYPNGTIVNAYTDAAAFAEELHTKLGEEPSRVLDYLQQSENLYNKIGDIFLNTSLHKRKMLLAAPIGKALAATRRKHILQSLHQLNKDHFKQPATVQLFDRFATYNGSNPYKAPGMLSLIPHLEQNEGTFYPKGGMISITNALYKLALKQGVQFYFDSPVERIISHEQRVHGVVVNGENIKADLVVSNGDAYFTYKHLLKDEYEARKILKQERSSSAIIFYWGMNKQFPQLHLHNIFFSKDYAEEFTRLFNQKTLSADPTVYINITSKMEAAHAPAGGENWFVMVNAPANVGQDWQALKQYAKQAILSKLSAMLGEDIEPYIAVEETLDPVKIEAQTQSYMGSLYGTSSNSKMAAFLRHPNFTSKIKGLYFAGGSVHPGGGIPLCLKSAAIVSKIIEADKKKLLHH
ncbi:1-hydroxycarotenoid 3,4-desaturase CrtD [Aridibaculum aurantiacum]|uniref:1-hydroxycarotenoid 3,4-desaturase CrtD n=1 Tax=Aridibaculum aurantiacum TaxID=2810307 RepID=UPI001A96A7E1|nr:1-hydroxycarotenoid 3,4-desaturase CrtD [Aridibaculum aurantiacum]